MTLMDGAWSPLVARLGVKQFLDRIRPPVHLGVARANKLWGCVPLWSYPHWELAVQGVSTVPQCQWGCYNYWSCSGSGEEVSISLRLCSRTTDRPDTPHPCIQQEHRRKEQTRWWKGNFRRNVSQWMCNQNRRKRKRHHAESDDIRRDETMKTPKKLATGIGQMRHCCDRQAERIHCKSWKVGGSIWRHRGQSNPSCWRSYRMWRRLMGVMCFQEWNVVEIGKLRHEGITKTMKVHAILHFCGEDICRIHFTNNMLDGDCLSWTHLRTEFSRSSMCHAALEVMLWEHWMQASLSL